MATIRSLIIRVGADISQLQKGLNDAQKRMRKTSNELSRAGRSLTTGITLPLAAVGGAAVKMAMDAVESENLFSVSMGKMADDARKWSEELRSQLGLNAYEVRKNVSTFNVMLDSMGLAENAAFDMAKGLTQLSYDMASFYNLKPEEAFQKLQAGISGEIEPLKRLGILIGENTIKQVAYNNGIAEQGAKLTEQQKVFARYVAIMDQTKKAQGDLARTIESPTNQLRIQQQQVKQLAIDLGINLLPTVKSLLEASKPAIEMLTNIIDKFNKLSPGTQQVIIKTIMFTAAIGPAMLVASQMINVVDGLIGAFRILTPTMLTSTATTTAATTATTGLSLSVGALALELAAIVGPLMIVIGCIKDMRDGNKLATDSFGILGQSIAETRAQADRMTYALSDAGKAAVRNSESQKEMADEMSSLKDRIQTANTSFQTQSNVLGDLSSYMNDFTSKVNKNTEALKENAKAMAEVINKSKQMHKNSLDSAMKAVKKGDISLKQAHEYAGSVVKQKMGAEGLKGLYQDLKKTYYEADTSTLKQMFKARYGVEVPSFGTGGTVPGPIGAPRLIMAHGGETVLPTHKGGGNMTVIVQMDGREVTRALLPYMPGELAKVGVKV